MARQMQENLREIEEVVRGHSDGMTAQQISEALKPAPPRRTLQYRLKSLRLRTAKTRNCLSEKTALSLVHQLAMSAEKRWRRLRGFRHRADVLADVRFTDGMEEKETGRKPLDSGQPYTRFGRNSRQIIERSLLLHR